MFKKKFTTTHQNKLKSSEQRKIKSQITSVFNFNSEEVETIFSNNEELVLNTIRLSNDKQVKIRTHRQVFEKLSNGAELMLPGVIIPEDGFPAFNVGDAVSIVCEDLVPVGVASSYVSSEELNASSTMRGKGFYTLHTYGDFLWQAGDKSLPHQVGVKEETEKNSEDNDFSDYYFVEKENATENTNEYDSTLNVKDISNSLSTKDMDDLLETSFMTCLTRFPADDKKIFPISASVFYESYIINSRPIDTELDVKQRLLKLKERNGELLIVSLNANHPLISTFIAPRHIVSGTSNQSTKSEDLNIDNVVEVESKTITLEYLYKPTGTLRNIIRAVSEEEFSVDKLYSFKEIKAILDQYIKIENLTDSQNRALIRVDENLLDATKKNTITRKQLMESVIKSMQKYHEVKFPGKESEIKKGSIETIKISVKQRAGRKTITVVNGFERYGIDYKILESEMKLKCAASTSITDIPPTKKNEKFDLKEIMVQGTKVKEIFLILENKFGIPFNNGDSDFVEVSYGKGVK
ncbi:Eukaryotic translation initiation factor 2D [Clydaea vesicula]|uniref:Eukaryotic translation initiation factor 2D n=1 Tax=Clydaea vesicula TaxID=447962 RepID=A0AAD5TX35_9FUNG|nr:Eukaryotic translation initiation factor 2D [Clydaea vesicula]